ncbi:Ssxb6 [Phodopus roborovskii]|uniref:Ssxb6 protein n=1 Tax=Phodopus roborovskii TaxID=109678 RepID=A0AAU9YZ08_PHORO|nr:Ssxb6 [Phodopus roborovskii]
MKTESCRGKNSLKAIREQKKCQPFQDISTYFSEEEWAKLTTWQKSAYTYMKRNYIRMTSLGVTVNQPVFMRCKEHVKESPVEVKAKADGPDNKDEDSEEDFYTKQIKRIKLTRVTVDLYDIRAKLGGRDSISASSIMPGVNTVRVNAWTHRLRVRKNRIIYEEISDPEEEEEDDDDNDNDDDED